MKNRGESAGYGFGTFQGVFTPSILTIIGVVMYLRFGWMLGNVGLASALTIITIGNSITFLTGLSISSLATNIRMKGGGAYFMLSRSLGIEAGAALGIPLALSQAVAVSFYVAGFSEALVQSGLPVVSGWDPRTVGWVTLAAISVLATVSADLALKSQYFIMGAIAVSLVSFFLGSPPPASELAVVREVPPKLGFWPVFAVFFPAVTGILSGLGMSGDLKNPSRSIPLGTMSAIVVGYLVYMSVPIVLNSFVQDPELLRSDTMIMQKCALFAPAILVGVWAATLSSAVGSFLTAPRVFQALSRDRVLPAFIGRGFGRSDDPRIAAALCFAIAATGVALGDINVIAPVLTLFNLSTYGLLCFSAAVEEMLSNPSWRPTFRVKAVFSFAGFAGCLAVMFMISPGWTFIAILCEAGIYLAVKRRALKVQWGDARTGIWAALAGFAFRRISGDRHAERNWRPNLLVFSRIPMRNLAILELAKGISSGRSFVSVASVLPRSAESLADTPSLADSVKRVAEKMDVEVFVKFAYAATPWEGISAISSLYGFGPVRPNTMILGMPSPESLAGFADSLMHMAREGRNVLVASPWSEEDFAGAGYIDIWWRGAGANGAFMLAIAVLLLRGDAWRKHPVRINMIVRRRSVEEAEKELAAFVKGVRIDAKTRVIDSLGAPFPDVISANSADAALTFVGLRPPRANEAAQSYGEYFTYMADGFSKVPAPVFVLASESVDFAKIFG